MRNLLILCLVWFAVGSAQAQIKEPVKFKTELKSLSDTEAEIVFTGTIEEGWHVYSTELGEDGPVPATSIWMYAPMRKPWANCKPWAKK